MMKRLSNRTRKVSLLIENKSAQRATRKLVLTTCASMQLLANAVPAFSATQPGPTGTHTQQMSGPAPANSGSFSNTSNLSVTPASVSATVAPAALPGQGTISTAVLNAIGSTITNSKNSTLIIDVSKQATPGTYSYSGTFNNAGTVYLVSSNPNIHNAVLQASSIYNQMSGIITTVLPSKGLQGYSGLVQNLGLTLAATNYVLNSGTISSAAALNITAGAQVINALPQGVNSNQIPVMSALSGLSIVTPSLINAGQISAATGNININSLINGNLYINNVAGSIAALNGNLNITTDLIAKTNLTLLGGTVSALQVNMTTGNGLLDLQVDNLSGLLNVTAGDGYVSTASNLRVGNIFFSGDPVVQSGGIIDFQPDPGSSVCTASGVFSGTSAIAECSSISTTGLQLNLSGSANLPDITSSSALIINAGSGITVGNISTAGSTVLRSTNGNIQTGNISTGNFGTSSYLQLQTGSGSISTGDLNLGGGLFVYSGSTFNSGNTTVTGGLGVGIIAVVNQATPFSIGAGNVASMHLNNLGTNTVVYIKNNGAGGITINPAGFTVDAPYALAQIAVDAGPSGPINFGPGTITTNSSSPGALGIIALSAGSITANGTILDVSNSGGGSGGFIVIGANNINTGKGLTLQADGLAGQILIGGTGAVTTTASDFTPPFVSVSSSWNGSTTLPVNVTGTALTAHANGLLGTVLMNASTMQLNAGNISFHADGTGLGFAGFAQIAAQQIIGTSSIDISANGAGKDSGGTVNVQTINPGTNLTVGPSLKASATGGPTDGDGGRVYLFAGGTLNVDTGYINASALGGNGNGGLIQLVGGTGGIAGGGVTFTNANASIVSTGKGTGTGGTVQIGGFGSNSNLNLPGIDVSGGVAGSGGEVDATAANNLTVASPIRANGGAQGGNGGNVFLNSGNNMTVNSSVSTTAGHNGTGGILSLSAGQAVSTAVVQVTGILNADGDGTGKGGSIYVQGPKFDIAGATVSADGGAAADAGTINIQSTNSAITSNIATGTTIQATGGSSNASVGNGSSNLSIISAGPITVAQGATIEANALGTAGSGGNIAITYSNSSTTQATPIGADVHADGPTGGAITIANSAGSAPLALNISGQISAIKTVPQGQMGVVNLNKPDGAVKITGAGSIAGNVHSIGTSVNINLTSASTLSLESVKATTGSVQVALSAGGSKIEVVPTQTPSAAVSATTTIDFQADSIDIGRDSSGTRSASLGQNGYLQAHDVNLHTNASSNGDITLCTDVRADDSSGTITATANGSGSVFTLEGGGSMRAHNVVLSGDLLSANVWTDNLTANGNNAQAIVDVVQVDLVNPTATRAINLNPATKSDIYKITAFGDINVNAALSANDIELRSFTGDIVIAASMTATGHMTLLAGSDPSGSFSGNIRQINSNAVLTASQSFVFGARRGTVGDSVNPLNIVDSSGIGFANIEINPLTRTADAYILQSVPGYGTLLGNIAVSDTLSITSYGNIRQLSVQNVSASDIRLTSFASTNGDIGTSANANVITVACDFLTAYSSSGTVFINNTKNSVLNVRQSQSYGEFNLHTSVGMNLYGITTTSANGKISAVTDSGTLQVLPGAVIDGAPTVLLEVKSTDLQSQIIIGAGAKVLANNPNFPVIHISIGDPNPALGAAPNQAAYPNVSFSTSVLNGILFVGSNISAPTPTTRIINGGGAIVLQANVVNTRADSILLGGGGALIQTTALYTPVPRVGATPGQGGQPPGQVGQAPGSNTQTNPSQTGIPTNESGQPPGISGPPTGQGAANPGQGVSIPAGQEQRVINLQKMMDKKSKKNDSSDTLIASEYTPVAFVTRTAPAFSLDSENLSRYDNAVASIKHDGQAEILQKSINEFAFIAGQALFKAHSRITVCLGSGTVILEPGSIVLIERKHAQLYVKCLHDTRKDSVMIKLNTHQLRLAAGQQVCIGDLNEQDEQGPIRNRHTFTHGDKNVSISEFPLTSTLSQNRVLSMLRRSCIKEDKRDFSTLLKTAVAVFTVTSKHGPYSKHG